MWPGADFELDARFGTVGEKKFWACVFFEVAHRIFMRRLGDQGSTSWQSGAIGDAYVVARMLTRAVQRSEPGWHPEAQGSAEDGAHLGGIVIKA